MLQVLALSVLRYLLVQLALLPVLLCSCSVRATPEGPLKGETVKLKLTSASFEDGDMIPPRHTCDGANVSPPLAWDDVPATAAALALICDDPDAPMGTWVHWVLYDLPPDITELPEGVPTREVLDSGARQGRNGSRRIGYGGPCPPSGTHRYYFKLYALDDKIDLPPGATKKQLLAAMEGHILAEGQLMGRYKRG